MHFDVVAVGPALFGRARGGPAEEAEREALAHEVAAHDEQDGGCDGVGGCGGGQTLLLGGCHGWVV